MANKDENTFCKRMRKATREIHTISDTLVNTKLAFGLFDNSIWADGLLVFYEIFRHLELSMDNLTDTEIGLFPLDELRRTGAFEKDLEYYLGKEWKTNYTVRDSVTIYLKHLSEIESTEPRLLIAYIYHLYMGLLSGGIILRKKRQLMRKAWILNRLQESSNNITDFGDFNIFELKKRIRNTMNEIADTWDEDMRNKLLEESKTVFALNNELIRSVQGTSILDLLQKLLFLTVPIVLLLAVFLAPYNR